MQNSDILETLESNGPKYNIDLSKILKSQEPQPPAKKPKKKQVLKLRPGEGTMPQNPINKQANLNTISQIQSGQH